MSNTFKPMLSRPRFAAALDAAFLLTGVRPSEVLSDERDVAVSKVRQAIWLALRLACEAPVSKLGRYFDRDYTTVIYGLERAAQRAREDAEYAAAIELIAAEVRAA